MVRAMLLAGAFAAVLCIGLILGDWMFFSRLSPDAGRYGCQVSRATDRLSHTTLTRVRARFNQHGVLALSHGVARLFAPQQRVVIRPLHHLFSLRFRTAWPLKGVIELAPDGDDLRLLCAKRTPWSSAIITLTWFAIVGLGTVGFLITYSFQGGLASLSGILMGAGITGLGLLVLLFGVMTVALAYRLENSRLNEVYQELKTVLEGTANTITG